MRKYDRCPFCGKKLRCGLANLFGGRCGACNNKFYTRFLWLLLIVIVLSPVMIHFILHFDIILDIAIFSFELIALGIYALIGVAGGIKKYRTEPYGMLSDTPQIYTASIPSGFPRVRKGDILITDPDFDTDSVEVCAPINVVLVNRGELRLYFLYENQKTRAAIEDGTVQVFIPSHCPDTLQGFVLTIQQNNK